VALSEEELATVGVFRPGTTGSGACANPCMQVEMRIAELRTSADGPDSRQIRMDKEPLGSFSLFYSEPFVD
jgi:hypothetical protein